MLRSEVLRRISVGEHELVIDVCGGHSPYARADLVIENAPFESSLHRVGPVPFFGVPIIKADLTRLPVPDGGAALAFVSHVVEHLADPRAFMAEIRRCARTVYLEFPTRQRELMYAWSFHAWLVEADGGVLRFYRNDLPQLFLGLFHAGFDAALGPWTYARHELLNTSIYCRTEALACEFPDETATELLLRTSPRGAAKIDIAASIPRPRYSLAENVAFAAQSFLPVSVYDRLARRRRARSTGGPAPLPDAVIARLMCVQCRRTTLHRRGDVVSCDCGVAYGQDRSLFDFDLTGVTP